MRWGGAATMNVHGFASTLLVLLAVVCTRCPTHAQVVTDQPVITAINITTVLPGVRETVELTGLRMEVGDRIMWARVDNALTLECPLNDAVPIHIDSSGEDPPYARVAIINPGIYALCLLDADVDVDPYQFPELSITVPEVSWIAPTTLPARSTHTLTLDGIGTRFGDFAAWVPTNATAANICEDPDNFVTDVTFMDIYRLDSNLYDDTIGSIQGTWNFEPGEYRLCYKFQSVNVWNLYRDITLVVEEMKVNASLVVSDDPQVVTISDRGTFTDDYMGWTLGDCSELSTDDEYVMKGFALADNTTAFDVFFELEDVGVYRTCYSFLGREPFNDIGIPFDVRSPAPEVTDVKFEGGDKISTEGSGVFTLYGDRLQIGTIDKITYGGNDGLLYECFNATKGENGTLSCEAVAGSGNDLKFVVHLSTAISESNTLVSNIEYEAPEIIDVVYDPDVTSSKGGTIVTVIGSKFGPDEAGIAIRFGPRNATILFMESEDTAIVVLSPPGSGAVVVQLYANGLWSNISPVRFAYAQFNLTSLEPKIGDEKGGTLLTMTGNELGIDVGNVEIIRIGEGATCDPVEVTYTQLICRASPGDGKFVDVSVTLVGLETVILEQAFSFVSPKISDITPREGSTTGGTRITIHGDELGRDVDILNIHVGDGPCTDMQIVTPDEEITCLVPPGMGTQHNIVISSVDVVSVGGEQGWNYSLPIVDSVFPSHGSRERETRVTIRGENLGFSLEQVGEGSANSQLAGSPLSSYISVAMGDEACTDLAYEVEHEQISCVLPAGKGTDLSISVAVMGTETDPNSTPEYAYTVICSAKGATGVHDKGFMEVIQAVTVFGTIVSFFLYVAAAVTLRFAEYAPMRLKSKLIGFPSRKMVPWARPHISFWMFVDHLQIYVALALLHGFCATDPSAYLAQASWMAPGLYLWLIVLNPDSDFFTFRKRIHLDGFGEGERLLGGLLSILLFFCFSLILLLILIKCMERARTAWRLTTKPIAPPLGGPCIEETSEIERAQTPQKAITPQVVVDVEEEEFEGDGGGDGETRTPDQPSPATNGQTGLSTDSSLPSLMSVNRVNGELDRNESSDSKFMEASQDAQEREIVRVRSNEYSNSEFFLAFTIRLYLLSFLGACVQCVVFLSRWNSNKEDKLYTVAMVVTWLVFIVFVCGGAAILALAVLKPKQSPWIAKVSLSLRGVSSFALKKPWWLLVNLAHKALVSLVLAFDPRDDETSTVLLLNIEVVFFVGILVVRPYKDIRVTVFEAAAGCAQCGLAIAGLRSFVEDHPRDITTMAVITMLLSIWVLVWQVWTNYPMHLMVFRHGSHRLKRILGMRDVEDLKAQNKHDEVDQAEDFTHVLRRTGAASTYYDALHNVGVEHGTPSSLSLKSFYTTTMVATVLARQRLIREHHAARRVQKHWRGFVGRKEFVRMKQRERAIHQGKLDREMDRNRPHSVADSYASEEEDIAQDLDLPVAIGDQGGRRPHTSSTFFDAVMQSVTPKVHKGIVQADPSSLSKLSKAWSSDAYSEDDIEKKRFRWVKDQDEYMKELEMKRVQEELERLRPARRGSSSSIEFPRIMQ